MTLRPLTSHKGTAEAPPKPTRPLVWIRETPQAALLAERAVLLARALKATLTVLYIETRVASELDEATRNSLISAMQIADDAGAELVTMPGEGNPWEVIEFARLNNVTDLIMERPRRSSWLALFFPTPTQELVDEASDVTLHVLNLGRPRPSSSLARSAMLTSWRRFDLVGLSCGLALVAIVTFLDFSLGSTLNESVVTLTFALTVLVVAVAFGLIPAVLASIASALCIDYFFMKPRYSLTVSSPEDVLTLTFFVVMAFTISSLTAQARNRMLMARVRAETSTNLYNFSRKLAGVATKDHVLITVTAHIARMLDSQVVILEGTNGDLVQRIAYPATMQISDVDLQFARRAWRENHSIGRGTEREGQSEWLFRPLRTPRGISGVIALRRAKPFTVDDMQLLDTLIELTGVAIERQFLANEIERAQLAQEAEVLKSNLLKSLAHDFKAPIVGIIGLLSGLRQDYERYDPETRSDLMAAAGQEAERLNRFLDNIISITRVEAGALELKHDQVDVEDLVGTAVHRLHAIRPERRIKIALAPDLPTLKLDVVLMEQVLFNLLDNAVKYTPPDSLITVLGEWDRQKVTLKVMDEGPGIPDGELELIFTKFHRVHLGDRRTAGTGLGLAICRGFVEALGGTISASNRTDRPGAVFTVTFPA
jgi:two-component system sensor histidine kinase KdpD